MKKLSDEPLSELPLDTALLRHELLGRLKLALRSSESERKLLQQHWDSSRVCAANLTDLLIRLLKATIQKSKSCKEPEDEHPPKRQRISDRESEGSVSSESDDPVRVWLRTLSVKISSIETGLKGDESHCNLLVEELLKSAPKELLEKGGREFDLEVQLEKLRVQFETLKMQMYLSRDPEIRSCLINKNEDRPKDLIDSPIESLFALIGKLIRTNSFYERISQEKDRAIASLCKKLGMGSSGSNSEANTPSSLSGRNASSVRGGSGVGSPDERTSPQQDQPLGQQLLKVAESELRELRRRDRTEKDVIRLREERDKLSVDNERLVKKLATLEARQDELDRQHSWHEELLKYAQNLTSQLQSLEERRQKELTKSNNSTSTAVASKLTRQCESLTFELDELGQALEQKSEEERLLVERLKNLSDRCVSVIGEKAECRRSLEFLQTRVVELTEQFKLAESQIEQLKIERDDALKKATERLEKLSQITDGYTSSKKALDLREQELANAKKEISALTLVVSLNVNDGTPNQTVLHRYIRTSPTPALSLEPIKSLSVCAPLKEKPTLPMRERLPPTESVAAPTSPDVHLLARELELLRAKFLCSLCSERWRDCFLRTCGHTFCHGASKNEQTIWHFSGCLESTLSSRNRKCPSCNQRFRHEDLGKIFMA